MTFCHVVELLKAETQRSVDNFATRKGNFPAMSSSPTETRGVTPFQLLAACCVLSSMGGVAHELRRSGQLDLRRLIAAGLYSAVCGISIGAIMLGQLGIDRWPMIVGISALAGVGAADAIDFAVHLLTGGIVSIRIAREDKGDDDAT
jgi:hypothetical protein